MERKIAGALARHAFCRCHQGQPVFARLPCAARSHVLCLPESANHKMGWPNGTRRRPGQFCAVFAKECAISGDVFFVVPSEERANHDVAMANGQGNYPSPEQVQAFTDQEALDLCLPQYNRSCGEKYGALRDERQSLSGVFLCDLEQNPDERALCGAVWPTLLTKSNIACFTRDDRVQFALPIEHMGAQGMHVVSCPQFGISVSPMRKHIERFSPRVIKEFAGRGMHLGALSAWMLFVLGNTMRIRFEYPCPPLTSMPDDECEDEV